VMTLHRLIPGCVCKGQSHGRMAATVIIAR
jgi:hypothetical protein